MNLNVLKIAENAGAFTDCKPCIEFDNISVLRKYTADIVHNVGVVDMLTSTQNLLARFELMSQNLPVEQKPDAEMVIAQAKAAISKTKAVIR
jgi:hypothetical protein